MVGWGIFVVYLLGFLGTWRRASWVALEDIAPHRPDGFEVGLSIFVGALVAAFWPVVVPGYVLWTTGILTRPAHGFIKPPRNIKKRAEMEYRERELMAREARIAALERDVHIDT